MIMQLSLIAFAANTPRRLSENRKPAAEKPFRPDCQLIFVTRTNCLYQMIKKSDSKCLPLATVPILGQPPGSRYFDLPVFYDSRLGVIRVVKLVTVIYLTAESPGFLY